MDSSRTKLLLAVILLSGSCLPAQNADLDLAAANLNQLGGKIYCYGLNTEGKSRDFVVYQLNPDLQILETKRYKWPDGSGTDLIPAWSDTLHGFLNIYVPEGQTKGVSLYRFNSKFELQKEAHHLEITKINPISGFENKLFYDRDMVYAIQTQKDSSGQGFYLNKYQLKKEYIGFEYDFVWQFPFERRNIRSAEVIFANPELVLVFVHVFAGTKKGQWILKINARTGRLIRGTRLGDKDSEDTYMYGAVNFEKQSKSLMLIGHKYNPSQYTYTSGKLMAPATASVQLYLNVLDSIGDPLIRQDLKISFSPQKPGTKQAVSVSILQVRAISKQDGGACTLLFDQYKQNKGESCFLYSNTFSLGLSFNGTHFIPENKAIAPNVSLESFVASHDKLDLNGKLCMDSSGRTEQIYNRRPSFPVNLWYGSDSTGNAEWLLSKSNSRKASIQYSQLKVQKNAYQLIPLEEIPKNQDPCALVLKSGYLLLGRQSDGQMYRIRLHKP